MERFRIRQLSTHKKEAQANLIGRTHYVDDATLAYHRSRILKTGSTKDGLLFGLVESFSCEGIGRRYRAVVFDVLGTVVTWHALVDARASKRAAENDLADALTCIDAKRHTRTAIRNHVQRYRKEMADFINGL